jgi:hypothetical protein
MQKFREEVVAISSANKSQKKLEEQTDLQYTLRGCATSCWRLG